jgi:transporter family protein
MKHLFLTWQFWAISSAVFAALTAIFAKVGVENVNSDFATFIRTIIILWVLAFILLAKLACSDCRHCGERKSSCSLFST